MRPQKGSEANACVCVCETRLAARSAFPVRTRRADFGPDVRPVLRDGELLSDQLLQDLPHQPPAGTRPGPDPGPEWTEAPDRHVAVSAPPKVPRGPPGSTFFFILSICRPTKLAVPPGAEAVGVAVETGGGRSLLRQQRALLPKARCALGKAGGCGERRAGGKKQQAQRGFRL